MTRPTPPRFRVLALAFALAGGAFWSIPSSAQSAPATPPPATGDTIRLTDEQRDLILSGITEDSAAAARGELTGPQRAERRIHGEVGVMIGSNGTRGAYGTAAIPLGDNAGAVVSFESTRYGYRR